MRGQIDLLVSFVCHVMASHHSSISLMQKFVFISLILVLNRMFSFYDISHHVLYVQRFGSLDF